MFNAVTAGAAILSTFHNKSSQVIRNFEKLFQDCNFPILEVKIGSTKESGALLLLIVISMWQNSLSKNPEMFDENNLSFSDCIDVGSYTEPQEQ
jgi:hypothetical protein